MYITINDQSASDGIYTPLNGSFIHVLGETFEVGSEDPVNDQLQGLRDALKTGINNLFGSAYGEWVDPMVFEDGRWDHDDHEENDGKHVTFIRFNKDRLNEFQVEELKNALEISMSLRGIQRQVMMFQATIAVITKTNQIHSSILTEAYLYG